MGSETTLSLPVIDFSCRDLKAGSSEWEKVKSQVRKAAEEYGCFYATLNNISEELQKAMNGAMEEIFALPFETKKLNVSELPFHGYVKASFQTSQYENIGIFHPEVLDKLRTFTNLMWPQSNINFSETVHSFSVPLSELIQIVWRMIAESFGIEKYLDEHINSSYNLLRLHKYEAPHTSEKIKCLNEHRDKNTITILYQNQTDGLEVKTKDGDCINVKFPPNSFLVIIGESLDGWTNGRLYSPWHSVYMSGNQPRYSLGLFSIPNYEVKAAEELVDEEHPLQFQPFRYLDFLKHRFPHLLNSVYEGAK